MKTVHILLALFAVILLNVNSFAFSPLHEDDSTKQVQKIAGSASAKNALDIVAMIEKNAAEEATEGLMETSLPGWAQSLHQMIENNTAVETPPTSTPDSTHLLEMIEANAASETERGME